MMISLKAMQTSFSPTKHALPFHTRGLFSNKKNPILLSLCKSNNSNSEDSPPPSEGDARKQELLARIAMLQTQKVRLTDYLDERSQYLTQFAEEANAKFDQIGEDALKGLDEASARIMENIESRMQAFEESTELDKQEIEKNVKNLEEFEDQIERDRNEGLFFKSLMQRKPIEKEKAKEEMEKIKEITIGSSGSKTRRNIYLALIGLIVISIVDSSISSSSEWQKLAILGVILVGLLSQLIIDSARSKTRRNICLALIGLLVIGIADSLISSSGWQKVAILVVILVCLLSQLIYKQDIFRRNRKRKTRGRERVKSFLSSIYIYMIRSLV